MKAASFGLATAVAIVLFAAFGSVGAGARASVTAHVVSMHAVLPDGALVDLSTNASVSVSSYDRWTL